MNALTTSKVVAYLSIIFVAGGATGAVITLRNARASEAKQASMEKVCLRVQDRLKAKLGLTDQQMKELQPTFDQTARELATVHQRAVCDTDRIIRKAHQEISKYLNPEQQMKLQAVDQERRAWLQRCFKGHEPVPSPAPAPEPALSP